MIKYSDFAGVIFDVDDTLLDNRADKSRPALHEQSRLEAAREVGRRRKSAGLQGLTEQHCVDAFTNSKVHSVYGAVWQMLIIAGEVSGEDIDFAHPMLKEIVELKEELHIQILRTRGREVPGATRFVEQLVQHGPEAGLAIASTACRRDIDIFLEMTALRRFFPEERVISRELFKNPKPHPEPFNLAFSALGLPENARSHVVAFEDDPRGIMSAKAAGLYTCAITTRFSRQELVKLDVVPDLIANSYAEFADLFGLPAKLDV